MNSIKQIEKLNNLELESGVSIEASWHNDYRDTAYIYFGGLPYNLTEGDIATIFSQFGNPVHVKLVRDKESGKSAGYGWLKFEDQRSTVLAVDNFNGTEIVGRKVRVDHAYYKSKEGDEEADDTQMQELRERLLQSGGKSSEPAPVSKQVTADDKDLEDPMKDFFASQGEVSSHRSDKHDEKSRRHRSDRHEDKSSHRDSRRSTHHDDSRSGNDRSSRTSRRGVERGSGRGDSRERYRGDERKREYDNDRHRSRDERDEYREGRRRDERDRHSHSSSHQTRDRPRDRSRERSPHLSSR